MEDFVFTMDKNSCDFSRLVFTFVNKTQLCLTNSGELSLSNKGKSIKISKEMIQYYLYIDNDRTKKEAVCAEFHIYFTPDAVKILGEDILGVKLDKKRTRIFSEVLLRNLNSLENKTAKLIVQIFELNGINSKESIDAKRQIESIKSASKIINSHCHICKFEWNALEKLNFKITNCPKCRAAVSSIDLSYSETPLEEFIINSEKIIKYKGNRDIVVIPKSIREIGEKAFCACKGKILIINKNIKKIESLAFANMPELEKVELITTKLEIADDVFQNCNNLKSISMPRDMDLIKTNSKIQAIFEGCVSLEAIVMPEKWERSYCATEANVMSKTTKIYTRLSKEVFESEDVSWTYTEPKHSENYGVYVGNMRVGSIRETKDFSSPWSANVSRFSMPDNTTYGYWGTPDLIPFLWNGGNSKLTIKGDIYNLSFQDELCNKYRRKEADSISCIDIRNGGFLEISRSCKGYKSKYYLKEIYSLDAGAILSIFIKKPSTFSQGEIKILFSTEQLLSEYRGSVGKKEIIFKYSKQEGENIDTFISCMQKSGITVMLE